MPESKCSACGSKKFEVVHAQNLEGTNRSILFVQCAACGGVVGTLDFLNVGLQVNSIRNELERAANRVRKHFDY